jgi:membrane-associated phospholipid phosphatase
MSTSPQENRERVRRALEEEIERVDSLEAAERVVQRIEQLAAGVTEEDKAREAASAPACAAAQVEQAAGGARSPEEAAAVLVETAAQAVAPTADAPAVRRAAREALAPVGPAPSPAVGRGRSLLKEAVLRHMGPLQALDARLYLAINCVPHPRWLDRLAEGITLVTTGGALWVFGLLIADLLGVPKSWRAVKTLLPSLVGATWIVEYPIKSFVRRRRPFIDIVRGLVVGKKPGSWSFPSGHTASSFACAWVLTTIWPRSGPAFFALASCVGLSRIYVGAHYPGDVASGAFCGASLAELIRRALRWAIAAVDRDD